MALRDRLDLRDSTSELTARFDPPAAEAEVLLTRTHPLVEDLATFVFETALDELAEECLAIGYTGTPDSPTTRYGVPDDAFRPIEGDDKPYCSEWKKANKKSLGEQLVLLTQDLTPWQHLGDLPRAMARLGEAQ